MTFYFAWVDKEDDTFLPEYAREDEDVFAFSLQHSEGDFPVLEVELVNPRVGLLAPSRYQWMWLSQDSGTTEGVVPLFFGRLLGVPQEMQNEVVKLTFVARPSDYEAQRSALAQTLRVRPYYDPAWLSDEARLDPDAVLEGRSALWHIDRVTHELTISDITNGEDGLVTFLTGEEAFYDSVKVTHGQSPLRRVDVSATVQWMQAGSGTIDITPSLLNQFAENTPDTLSYIDNTQAVKDGLICIAGGDEFAKAWPQEGARIGGGWSVGVSYANVVGDAPLLPMQIGDIQNVNNVRARLGSIQTNGIDYYHIFNFFKKSPGFISAVHKYPPSTFFAGAVTANVDLYWVPIWRIAPHMELNWSVERSRTEVVNFSVSADVQPLLSDANDEETERLTFGPINVDDFIHDSRSPRYFGTARGFRSFEYLLARTRALLLARARAVNVEFQIPFELGVDLSLRKSATLVDPRIPGGQATGKVVGYTLSSSKGELLCSVNIACTIGRDGSVTIEVGNPTYVEDGYVADGYQATEDDVNVPFPGDIGYGNLQNYAIDDDGVSLFHVGYKSIEELTVTGGLTGQMNGIEVEVTQDNIRPAYTADAYIYNGPMGSSREIADSINAANTGVRIVMRPVTGGPFATGVSPTVTDLKIPATIDLE